MQAVPPRYLAGVQGGPPANRVRVNVPLVRRATARPGPSMPRWTVRREQFRRVLSYYQATRPITYRKQRREPGSGDTAVRRAGASLRE